MTSQKNLIFGPPKEVNKTVDLVASNKKPTGVLRFSAGAQKKNPYQIYAKNFHQEAKTQSSSLQSSIPSFNQQISIPPIPPNREMNKENANIEVNSQRSGAGPIEVINPEEANLRDLVNFELQLQIPLFRKEMEIAFQQALNEFMNKTIKNKETIKNIQDSLNFHNQSFTELSRRLGEYSNNLNTVNLLLKTEIDYIKTSLSGYNNDSKDNTKKIEQVLLKNQLENRIKITESQQKEIDTQIIKLKEDFKKQIQMTFNQKSDIANDNNENPQSAKLMAFTKEIASSWERKIRKVTDHLNGKVSVLEKQMESYDKQEDSIIDKVKFEIENKIYQSVNTFNEHLNQIKLLLEAKPDMNKEYHYFNKILLVGNDTNLRLEQIKNELEVFKQEFLYPNEAHQAQIYMLESKMEQFQNTINKEIYDLQQEANRIAQYQTNINLSLTSDQIQRINVLHSTFNGLINQQQMMKSDLDNTKITFDEATKFIRQGSASTIEAEAKIKKLEEIVANLTHSVELLKAQSNKSNYNSAPVYTVVTEKVHYNYNQQQPAYFTQQGTTTNQNLDIPKPYELINPDQKRGSIITESSIDDSSSTAKRYDFKDITQINSSIPSGFDLHAHEESLASNSSSSASVSASGKGDTNNLFRKQPDNNQENLKKANNAPSISYSTLQTPMKVDPTPKEFKFETFSKINQMPMENTVTGINYSPNIDINPGNAEAFGERKKSAQPQNSDPIEIGIKDKLMSYNQPDSKASSTASIEDDNVVKGEIKSNQEEEEVSVVFQMDENGYLMDENGNYIYDESGNMLKITEEQLENLKADKILEDKN